MNYLNQCWSNLLIHRRVQLYLTMMTSSNGNVFRVTGLLCGEFTGPGEFPSQRPVTRSFDVFFDLCQNKQVNKQSQGWWSETPSSSLWRQCNAYTFCVFSTITCFALLGYGLNLSKIVSLFSAYDPKDHESDPFLYLGRTKNEPCMDHCGYGISQRATMLHCNVVSYWMSPNTESLLQ